MKYANIFYFKNINEIGGVETYLYEIAKKYNQYDITIVYKYGNPKQIKRLRELVRVKKHTGATIYCEKAFINYDTSVIDKFDISADEYIQVIHTDYSKVCPDYKPHPEINKYIGVSKVACDGFERVTGIKCELCYNPFTLGRKKEKPLMLVSAQRLTPEKGKTRIEKMAKILDDSGRPYLWTIYTDDRTPINSPNVIFVPSRLDVRDFLPCYDYYVQLSDDCEGYGYSVVEALSSGTPCILTPCKVYEEIGVNETNSILVDFDVRNVCVSDLFDRRGTFNLGEYKVPPDKYSSLLSLKEQTYSNEKEKMYSVFSLGEAEKLGITLEELSNNRADSKGFWQVNYEELQGLLGENVFNIPLVDVVGEHENA